MLFPLGYRMIFFKSFGAIPLIVSVYSDLRKIYNDDVLPTMPIRTRNKQRERQTHDDGLFLFRHHQRIKALSGIKKQGAADAITLLVFRLISGQTRIRRQMSGECPFQFICALTATNHARHHDPLTLPMPRMPAMLARHNDHD